MNTTNSTTLACHPLHTKPSSLPGMCLCYQAYYGPYCDEEFPWWTPITIVYVSIGIASHLFLLFWLIMRMIYMFKRENVKGYSCKITDWAFWLTFVGLMFRLVELSYPDNSTALSDAYYSNVVKPPAAVTAITVSFLTLFAAVPRISAFTLCLGFWVDVLFSKFNKVYSGRIKAITAVTAIALFVLTLFGILILYVVPGPGIVLGEILYIAPLWIVCFGYIITCSIIGCYGRGSDGAKKHSYVTLKQWALPLFIIGTVFWSLLALSLLIASIPGPVIGIILEIFWMIDSFVTTVVNIELISRKKGFLVLWKWLFLGVDVDSAETKSSSVRKMTTNSTMDPGDTRPEQVSTS